MNKTIRVKIVTPVNVVFDMEARMITMPGALGEFEVLPGHELLIANLKDGLTKIIVDNSVFKYFIYSGLAEVTWTNVNIVTEFAVDTSSLQLHEIIRKIDSLTKAIYEELDDTKIDIIKLDIARYESLLAHIKRIKQFFKAEEYITS